MKYQVIVSDPPYGNFNDKLRMSNVKRGADDNYDGTMTTEEICNLPIKQITDENGCILALWVPSSLILDGIKIMQAYGFTIKQSYVWVKTKKNPLGDDMELIKRFFNKLGSWHWTISGSAVKQFLDNFSLNNIMSFGMGRLFRQSHEICLIGTNNNGIYKKLENHSQRSVCFAPNLKHSSKPEDLQNSLDIMFKGNKLELFARRKRDGWLCLGNELEPYEDIKVSLNKIINGH
jgi:N6-adenosine-specific RNA methylase IME4